MYGLGSSDKAAPAPVAVGASPPPPFNHDRPSDASEEVELELLLLLLRSDILRLTRERSDPFVVDVDAEVPAS